MAGTFKLRIESLSDLVFGFALSLGGIALLNLSINNVGDVLRGLFWFTFGFLILIGMWVSYSKIMSKVKLETALAMYLNIALLLLVVLEPYMLNLLAFDPSLNRDTATTLYALDLVSIWLIMAGLYHIALRQDAEDAPMLRSERNLRVVHSAIFLLSLLPVLWTTSWGGVELRYIMWFMAWPIGFVAEKMFFPTESVRAEEPI